MVRYRVVKKWGNSFVIVLKMSDIRDLNLKMGDLIDIEDAVKQKSIPDSLSKELVGDEA
jgi:antitoxin component of MazEF toxin-antitoxin module